jgi:hypothetical protein
VLLLSRWRLAITLLSCNLVNPEPSLISRREQRTRRTAITALLVSALLGWSAVITRHVACICLLVWILERLDRLMWRVERWSGARVE